MAILIEQEIKAPVEHVFQRLTDLDKWSETVSGIESVEKLTDGPVGVGTRFKETRVMFGKSCTEEMEFAEFRPNSMYAIEAHSCGCLYRTEIHCESSGASTKVRMEMNSKPLTLMAKLMSPMGWMMSGMMKKCLAQDLVDIKQAIEGGGTSPEPVG